MNTTYKSALATSACVLMLGCTIETNLVDTLPDAAAPHADVDASVPSSCTATSASVEASADATGNVDILVMVDNSGSMAQEQARLAEKLTRLITKLTSGDVALGTEAGGRVVAPRSVHVGIVTSDLGAPPGAVSGLSSTCAAPNGAPHGGGLLQSTGWAAAIDQVDPNTSQVVRPAEPACADVDFGMPYLAFSADDVRATNASALEQRLFALGCAATVGVSGCGIEQPLESVWKALAPQSQADFVGPDTRGQGNRGNAGFLREDSVLAVIVMSDEDDCSVTGEGTEMFEADGGPALSVRCQLLRDDPAHAAGVHRTSRYVNALLGLRPGHPERLVFVGLVGLPQSAVDYTAFDALLDDPRMQNRLREGSSVELQSVCGSDEAKDGVPASGVAYPGRRFVEVAKGIAAAGGQAVLRPICDDDYGPVLDDLAQNIARQLVRCN